MGGALQGQRRAAQPVISRSIPRPCTSSWSTKRSPAILRFPVETQADELRKRLEGYGGYMATVRDQITDPSLVVYRPLEAIIMPAPR